MSPLSDKIVLVAIATITFVHDTILNTFFYMQMV